MLPTKPMPPCYGILPADYINIYLGLFLVTCAFYAVIVLKEKMAQSGKKSVMAFLRSSLQLGTKSSSAGLKTALLSDVESGDASGPRVPLRLESAAMAQSCKNLEVASLATLLVMEHRRRYSNISLGVKLGNQVHEFDVEMTEKTSFASLTVEVDHLLTQLKTSEKSEGAEAKPEVIFTWGLAQATPGLWAMNEEAGCLKISGSGPEEEKTYELLFKAFAEKPNTVVWEPAMVPSAFLEQVTSWGAPHTTFPDGRDTAGNLIPVPTMLVSKKHDPKSLAVAGNDFQITHEQLLKRAAIVSKVVSANADPSKKKAVVVCMARGEAIAPTFVGVLAAGFHVVPVDVHWPQDRILQVAENAEAGLALAEPKSLSLLEGTSLKALAVDSAFFEQHTNGADTFQPVALSEEQPAIILFTSGSTGKPKGIVLPHRYLTALALGVAESKRMTSRTKTLCYHSPTWMPFIDYLFCPLLTGGCCLYFPDDGSSVVRPAELNAFAKQHGATSAGFVPAVLDLFAEEGFPPTLSDIGVGGAAVPAALCERLVDLIPQSADGSSGILYTGYSGTEQGDVTQLKMRGVDDVEGGIGGSGFMGAGRPHTSQRLAILDPGFNVVGPDAVGEITVTGPGLASGYLKLPEKTAETFLPSCKALSNERAARSGDLGKWTKHGVLKLVGRRDSMVKVRGARIELGEVEGTVASHPAVQSSVVVVLDDKLVAYVTPAVPADLRDYCKARLVSYMVPHVLEGLEELPKLPNGKVNKKALPKPAERTDGAETVMELDSLGQMRKFTRKAVSEDRVLDNVRAILIGIVLQSHATPLIGTSTQMMSSTFMPLPGHWQPVQMFILQITRGGGWSSLAFLNGFDDTRAMKPYGLTYREPLFIFLWLLLDFNWTMWYLPVFVYMRAAFCAMHWLGMEKLHMLLASQIWLIMPAFVDLYIGWKFPQETPAESAAFDIPCPSGCFCPWQEWPWAQTFSHYTTGWWVEPSKSSNSMIGHAMIFIPCYWIGFYTGDKIFKVLTKVADEPNLLRRVATALFVLALYCAMYSVGTPITEGFQDTCDAFWSPSGSFLWVQLAKNVAYYVLNLSMSLTYVVFIAAAVPIHLKYLAKICFASLIVSGLIPCVLDTPSMALHLRQILPASISPGIEIGWTFFVPFLFELVVGAVVTFILPIVIKAGMAAFSKFGQRA
eukprot:TRINITY_DN2884_c0_g1_i4.p1 TRINITY_DN2884_c0_g1~~TRINITY_DN2884_c0_g1_i4.p1  ORF type:complete len:1180 (-),score=260.35 TRINITY_DN2884_c0_g1_i4:34-3573(-)